MTTVVAHRGDSAHFPENTFAAFEAALAAGAGGIELDLQQAKGGIPIVLHDATLERTTGYRARAEQLSVAELQTLDAGGGSRIETLDALLKQFSRRTHLYLEVKDVRIATATRLAIARHDAYASCTVIGFDWLMLGKIKSGDPRVAIGLSAEKVTPQILTMARHLDARAILPGIYKLTGLQARAIRAAGFEMVVWTCNSEEEIGKAIDLGADGIMGDDPAALRARLA